MSEKNKKLPGFFLYLRAKTVRVFGFLKNIAEREITLFSNYNFSFSFKPFLIAKGLIVLFFFFVAVSFLVPNSQPNDDHYASAEHTVESPS